MKNRFTMFLLLFTLLLFAGFAGGGSGTLNHQEVAISTVTNVSSFHATTINLIDLYALPASAAMTGHLEITTFLPSASTAVKNEYRKSADLVAFNFGAVKLNC